MQEISLFFNKHKNWEYRKYFQYKTKNIQNKLCKICNFDVCVANEVTHFDLKYGEWYAKKNSLIARLIFNMGAKLGFGTLLYAIAKKR